MSEANRLEEIFSQALQLSDANERRQFVEQACGGNVELAQRVSALLRAALEAGQFLEQPWPMNQPTRETKPPKPPADSASRSAEFQFLTTPLVPGDLGSLGPYRILNCVGRGGMGIVFRAFDPKLQRVVAIKVLAPEIAANPTARLRFEREARSAAAVSHPHVVVIHAVDETYNPPYLVMEFVQGMTLAEKLAERGMLSLKEILRIGAQIAEGLAAAHKQGLVHRDVKPANVLLENGVERVKVTDFGLAKAVDDVGMTRTGELSGTPQYMSPEQASGALVDHRTDLFSLGAVLYTMCTGRPPFRADNPLAILKRICEDAPRPIEQVNPEVPDWLSAIVDRLLTKSPADRFQTAAEVAALLQKHLALVQAGPNAARPARETQSRTTGSLRRRWLWPILAFGLLAGIGVLVWLAPTRTRHDAARFQEGMGDSPRPTFSGTLPKTGANRRVAVEGKGWQEWPADAPKPAIAPFDAEQAKKHQEDWAVYLNVPIEHTNSLGMKFLLIPPGEFTMGSTPAELVEALKAAGEYELWQRFVNSEGPQHKVTLTQPIFLGVHEVTQKVYEAVMRKNPSHFAPNGTGKDTVAGMDTMNHPVEQVSWNDGADFCAKLSEREKLKPFYSVSGETVVMLKGTGYRLPTEAEWEFACRAGTTTKYWIGDNDEVLTQAAWFRANSGSQTHKVGELTSNPFGLCDIHGNLWEWVQDWWGPNYYAQFQEKPAIDPGGPFSDGSQRVIRGGAWDGNPPGCRASDRDAQPPTDRNNRVGFRVALPVDVVKAAIAAELASAEENKSPDAFDGTDAGDLCELTDLKIAFRWCPPGHFTIGGPKSEGRGKPVEMMLPHGFWIQETEVTQSEWATLMGSLPSHKMNKGKGDLYPIYSVSVEEAKKFCRKLTDLEREAGRLPSGWEYRLPTEAEWEYACRAGTTTDTAFGDQLSSTQANFNGDWPHNGAPKGPHHEQAVKVRSYRPNAWGIYDMHGNVKEFTTTPGRVRGGSWCDSGRNCCSEIWIPDPPTASESVGFRVVLVSVP